MKLLKYIMSFKECKSPAKFLKLYQIYNAKQEGFTDDLYIPAQGGLRKSDVKVMTINRNLSNGHVARYVLFDIGKRYYSNVFKDIYYDMIQCDDLKPIRSCTLKEFIMYYGKILPLDEQANNRFR